MCASSAALLVDFDWTLSYGLATGSLSSSALRHVTANTVASEGLAPADPAEAEFPTCPRPPHGHVLLEINGGELDGLIEALGEAIGARKDL
ncbi:hypothetical protein LSM04_003734 [Trypanosoma melophagium]|uniref:uncharacterized protein n=1 Tax=Trypanosoma melophagium TaxID=715481 RepID=UPI00351A421F|nr:hypothetical protein LSM04_003734 [Trypanosoma melophagium]